VPTTLFVVSLFVEVRRLPMMVCSRLMMGGRLIVRQTAETPDLRHMLAVTAYRLAASAASFACFLRVELMRGASLMSGAASHTRDLTLSVVVHRRKAARGSTLVAGCHFDFLSYTVLVCTEELSQVGQTDSVCLYPVTFPQTSWSVWPYKTCSSTQRSRYLQVPLGRPNPAPFRVTTKVRFLIGK
jgi:hypothetical protein